MGWQHACPSPSAPLSLSLSSSTLLPSLVSALSLPASVSLSLPDLQAGHNSRVITFIRPPRDACYSSQRIVMSGVHKRCSSLSCPWCMSACMMHHLAIQKAFSGHVSLPERCPCCDGAHLDKCHEYHSSMHVNKADQPQLTSTQQSPVAVC